MSNQTPSDLPADNKQDTSTSQIIGPIAAPAQTPVIKTLEREELSNEAKVTLAKIVDEFINAFK